MKDDNPYLRRDYIRNIEKKSDFDNLRLGGWNPPPANTPILRDNRLSHEELEKLLAEMLSLMSEMAHSIQCAGANDFTERFMQLRDRVAWRA